MKVFKILFVSFAIILTTWLIIFFSENKHYNKQWELKSIDTMKYSRDLARATLKNQHFEYSIENQVADIEKTGATHIAIGTPYDSEFLPVLKLWVKTARKNNLKVFFRGNFAGWEGWFDYKRIDRKAHLEMTQKFILENSELFEDGDIFSSCPECENGSELNLDDKNSIKEHQDFLIAQNRVSQDSFRKIGKNIPNYFSMNADVAHKVMNRQTTRDLGGIVVIDHYVASADILSDDIRALAEKSGGDIILGEFGAPVPSIQGNMSQKEQKLWIKKAMRKISNIPELKGVNYWVNVGGSTALWGDYGEPKESVRIIKDFYTE